MTGWKLHERIIHILLMQVCIVACLDTIPNDHALLTALVEQWRQKTHTFHFLIGKTTVTLQDVDVLLGLQIDGRPVIRSVKQDVLATCHELLV